MKKYLSFLSLLIIIFTAGCSHDLLLPSKDVHMPEPAYSGTDSAGFANGLPYITYTENYQDDYGSNIIMILFSQPMAENTLNKSNITLRDISVDPVTNITFNLTVSADKQVLTLYTQYPWALRGNIERILSTNITDSYGRPLAGLGHATTAANNWRRKKPWEYRAIAAADTYSGTTTLIEPATVSASNTYSGLTNMTVYFSFNAADLNLAASASNISNAFSYSGDGAQLIYNDIVLPGLSVELTNMTNGLHTVAFDPACFTNTAAYSGGALIELPGYVVNTWSDGSDFSITYNNQPSTLNPDIWNVNSSFFINISNSGDATWEEDFSEFSDGTTSLKSGTITHNELSSISLVINGPANISFDWMVSSENNWDYLRFYIDGGLQTSISGITGWATVNDSVGAGVHSLTWTYSKDGSVSDNQDCGWIDKIIITAP